MMLAALLAASLPWARSAEAQGDPAKGAPKADAPAAKAAAPEAAAAPDDAGMDRGTKGEVFLDPNAKKTLEIFSPINYVGPPIRLSNPPDDRSRLQGMAAGEENLNPELVKRYVDFFASELSKRDNLNAVLKPSPTMRPDAPVARALERAVDALTMPIIVARARNNGSFQANYNRVLFESSLPKLLDNNYLSRLDAMIVLGMAGNPSPAGLDLYIAQIKKPDQILWVKQWAAHGLTYAAQEGRANLEQSKAIQAAEAVIGLLDSDPKLPYPVQIRALEALGSIRLSTNAPRGKVDAASTALRFLADPNGRSEVRAYAAWALGMMRAPGAINSYNFALIGHEIGELAADLGASIVEEFDDNASNFDKAKDQATRSTGLLMFQVVIALSGDDAVLDSGLLRSPHPSLGPAKKFLTDLDGKVKAVAREAFELLRAGGSAQKGKRDDLDGRVADLKAFLGQTPPKDRHLMPGGPEVMARAAGR